MVIRHGLCYFSCPLGQKETWHSVDYAEFVVALLHVWKGTRAGKDTHWCWCLKQNQLSRYLYACFIVTVNLLYNVNAVSFLVSFFK